MSMIDDECSCGSGKPECACHCKRGQEIRDWPNEERKTATEKINEAWRKFEALSIRCTHPRIHLEYYDWLKTMTPDEKEFLLRHSLKDEGFGAVAMLAWSRSREVMNPSLPRLNPAWIDAPGRFPGMKPNTDEWTDLCGRLKDETDAHVSMLAHLPPDGPETEERYELRRMFFISLRQFFRETSLDELARLKKSA